MKITTIIVAAIVVLLVGGALFRVATMTPETEPLVNLGISESEEEPYNADQDLLIRRMRGKEWELESKDAPSEAELSEDDEFTRGEEILDSREEDLDEAKKRMRSVF